VALKAYGPRGFCVGVGGSFVGIGVSLDNDPTRTAVLVACEAKLLDAELIKEDITMHNTMTAATPIPIPIKIPFLLEGDFPTTAGFDSTGITGFC
jgi:hypothetical protein